MVGVGVDIPPPPPRLATTVRRYVVPELILKLLVVMELVAPAPAATLVAVIGCRLVSEKLTVLVPDAVADTL
jgi:hypothetical protein